MIDSPQPRRWRSLLGSAVCTATLLSLGFAHSLMMSDTGDSFQSISARYKHAYRAFTGERADQAVDLLPAVLNAADQEHYRQAFADQKEGDWKAADAEIAKLTNNSLTGYLLAQRFLHERYTSNPKELAGWLRKYGDHPQAEQIYALARRKGVSQAIAPAKASRLMGYGDSHSSVRFGDHLVWKAHRWKSDSAADSAWRKIRVQMKAGNLKTASSILRSARNTFSATDYDLVRWALANRYLNHDHLGTAAGFAVASANRSGSKQPGLYWLAGLTRWKQGKYDAAYYHFTKMAKHADALPTWDAAAASFWAYRAADKIGKTDQSLEFLQQAASYPRTFYGIEAARALKTEVGIQQAAMALSNSSAYLETPVIQRIAALAEIGRRDEAELEMRRLYLQTKPDERPQLLALASLLDLPAVQLRMTLDLSRSGKGLESAMYPMPGYRKDKSYMVDPALLFAIARQESGFNGSAKSHAGASGMMQIMPQTASYILSQIASKNANPPLPTDDMALGQRYISYLIDKPYIDGNLIYLASAYNAGPGNLLKWQKENGDEHDPLLFVETIPFPETRDYVLNIMTNYWIYSAMIDENNLGATSSLLAGDWPQYRPVGRELAVADDNGNPNAL